MKTRFYNTWDFAKKTKEFLTPFYPIGCHLTSLWMANIYCQIPMNYVKLPVLKNQNPNLWEKGGGAQGS
jgi:hypothetical protein